MPPTPWDPTRDEILLSVLFQTLSVKPDNEMIAAAWPKDDEYEPSARAINDRLLKIRKAHPINATPNTPTAASGGPAAATPRTKQAPPNAAHHALKPAIAAAKPSIAKSRTASTAIPATKRKRPAADDETNQNHDENLVSDADSTKTVMNGRSISSVPVKRARFTSVNMEDWSDVEVEA